MGAQAPADGYTILSSTDTLLLVGALKRVKFDVRKAFEPIVVMTTQPYLLVIEPALPVKSVKELIAYSKTKPLTYGTSGIGSTVHLGMERLAALGTRFSQFCAQSVCSPTRVSLMTGQNAARQRRIPYGSASASARSRAASTNRGATGSRHSPTRWICSSLRPTSSLERRLR